MRVILKLTFYAAALAALWWLVPQIHLSFERATAHSSTPDVSRSYALFAVYLLTSAALSVIVAWDLARLFGWQAERLFLGGGAVASFTPAMWKAERLRKQGEALEAIRVLRESFESHPRQWRMAVRIAEIYQHDLKNPLAAALEYEALLGGRLPRSARGGIMLRLAACYLVQRRADDAAAMLHRVLEEFPKSSAAAKARRRLSRMRE